MKIAIPLAKGRLTAHFGHCDSFAFVDVDADAKRIRQREEVPAPPQKPCYLPCWLAECGINTVIAAGMGQRALEICALKGITVLVGAPHDPPESLVQQFLSGTLRYENNTCNY